MNLSQLRLQVAPGDGVTAYFGSVALLGFDTPLRGLPFFDELLVLVQSAATSTEDGRSLVSQVAVLLARTPEESTIPFGLVASAGNCLAVLLHGSVTMTLTSVAAGQDAPLATEVVSGSDTMTWVDRLVCDDFQSLVLGATGDAGSSSSAQQPALEAGVSKGSAIAFLGGPAPKVDTEPAPPRSQFLSISLSGADAQALLALPRLGDEPATDGGIVAANLVLADGTAVPLTGNVVLGREPQNAPQVAAGSWSPFALPDEDRAVSRVHALVSLQQGSASVTDLGSANGTAIAQPGADVWVPLEAHTPVTLLPGSRIRIGGQELTYAAEDVALSPPVETPPEQEPPVAAIVAVQNPVGPESGIADYVFVRALGSGERGAYFLATPPARLQLEAQFVAVKVFRGATSDDAFRRATRELRAFAAAESQYLIKVHDAGQDQGQLFYSMDYVSGGSLAAPATPLDAPGIIKAVAQAARAAHALHEVGVVHQAIMPSNILLGETKAYLADLGLAQLISQESFATSLGDFDGLEFLDPSILTGAAGSRASDLWSLAATLHRALTGEAVYEGLSTDPLLAIRAVLTQQTQVSESLSPALAELIRSCLDPDVAARPATALDFAKQLEAQLPG
jgi:hypothetical protein